MSQDCGTEAWSESFKPEILYEDNHLLIVNKPAGMLTQADGSGQLSLLEHLKDHIKIRDRKPGNVYLGMVQRLDKPVSGCIVFAKTSKAAARISDQIRAQQMTKCYLAVTVADTDRQKPEDIATDGWRMVSHNLSRIKDRTIVDAGGAMTQTARLRLKTLLENGTIGIHAVQLITGRKHQIRAQLLALSMPILGDRKYGSSIQTPSDRILLHSYLLELVHPTRKTKVKILCTPSDQFFAAFTGQERSSILSALEKLSI